MLARVCRAVFVFVTSLVGSRGQSCICVFGAAIEFCVAERDFDFAYLPYSKLSMVESWV